MNIHTSALILKNEPEKAEAIARAAIKQQPSDPMLPAIAAHIFMNAGLYTNALHILDQQLQAFPKDPSALVNKGFVFLQLKRFDEAIPAFTRAMNLETNETSDTFQSALFNRAIANLQAGKLEQSRQDYETLLKSYPNAFRLYYGLAEVAYRGKDTNAAIQNYQLYLSNAPTNTPEAQFVRDRVKELEGKAPSPTTPPPSAKQSRARKPTTTASALNSQPSSVKLQISNCRFQISNRESEISSFKLQNASSESQISDLKFQIADSRFPVSTFHSQLSTPT
jgi:tetratricopeptide (TPR) repeat protein